MAKTGINRAGTLVRLIATFVVVGSLAGSLPGKLSAQNSQPKTGYAPVHGFRLYYEIHGAGAPLLLLHGGLRAGQMFSPIVPTLLKNPRVIVLDLLRDLCFTRPGLNGPAIFRISHLAGKKRCKPEKVDFVNSERIST